MKASTPSVKRQHSKCFRQFGRRGFQVGDFQPRVAASGAIRDPYLTATVSPSSALNLGPKSRRLSTLVLEFD
jgi:hypothetical protein